MTFTRLIETLRRPEYIGDNRCRACTVVNLLVAGLLTAILAVVSHVLVAVAVFVVSVAGIYLRGYLVPGTPTLTQRYFPSWLLRVFGKRPLDGRHTIRRTAASTPDDANPIAGAGVTNRTEAGNRDVTSRFRSLWRDRIEDVRARGPGTDDIRATFGAETASDHGRLAFDLDGSRTVRWDTEAGLVADVAAADLLQERVAAWSNFDVDQRQSVLLGLRLCLDACPACDAETTTIEEHVDPCCQTPRRIERLRCSNCGVLATAAVPESADESVRSELLAQ